MMSMQLRFMSLGALTACLALAACGTQSPTPTARAGQIRPSGTPSAVPGPDTRLAGAPSREEIASEATNVTASALDQIEFLRDKLKANDDTKLGPELNYLDGVEDYLRAAHDLLTASDVTMPSSPASGTPSAPSSMRSSNATDTKLKEVCQNLTSALKRMKFILKKYCARDNYDVGIADEMQALYFNIRDTRKDVGLYFQGLRSQPVVVGPVNGNVNGSVSGSVNGQINGGPAPMPNHGSGY